MSFDCIGMVFTLILWRSCNYHLGCVTSPLLVSVISLNNTVVCSWFKPWCGKNLGGVLVAGEGTRTPSVSPSAGYRPPNAHIAELG